MTDLTTTQDIIHACGSHAPSVAVALVVQDFYGGDILRCSLLKGGVYYYNALPTGEIVDLATREDTPVKAHSRVRERATILRNPDMVKAYATLLVEVVQRMRGDE